MLRGLRTAWWFAIGLSIISVFGHITKGIDYEEATIALLIIGSLIGNKKAILCKNKSKAGDSRIADSTVKYGSCYALRRCWILLSR